MNNKKLGETWKVQEQKKDAVNDNPDKDRPPHSKVGTI